MAALFKKKSSSQAKDSVKPKKKRAGQKHLDSEKKSLPNLTQLALLWTGQSLVDVSVYAADAQARALVQNALFLPTAKVDALVVPRCTYTQPEVASVVDAGAHLVEG